MDKQAIANTAGLYLLESGAVSDLNGDFHLHVGLGRVRLRGSRCAIAGSDSSGQLEAAIRAALLDKNVRQQLEQLTGTDSDLQSDYIEIPWRMLSKTIVPGWWLDFTKDNVLKSAIDKFNHLTIYTDHRPDIRNWVGVTTNPSWTEQAGQNPAGIDAKFKIDAVKEPDIARGFLMKPPAIKSNSVGINFMASRSHPDMEDHEFYGMMGREVDGQIVRWIVEEIVHVHETSLVYAGADPYANRQDLQTIRTDLSEPDYGPHNHKPKKQEGKKMKIKLMRSLLESCGINAVRLGFEAKEESREVEAEALHTALELAATQHASLQNRVQQFAALFGLEKFDAEFDYNKAINELQALLEEPKRELENVRQAALERYRQLEGEQADEVMLGLINDANLSQARAFLKKFESDLNVKHPIGPDGKTRASSLAPPVPGGSAGTEKQHKLQTTDYIVGGKK